MSRTVKWHEKAKVIVLCAVVVMLVAEAVFGWIQTIVMDNMNYFGIILDLKTLQ
jgi:hypothetical protein